MGGVVRSVTIGRNMALRRCRRNMNIALGAIRVSAPENALPGAHPRHAGLAGVEHDAAVGDRVVELFER
jgi:hypothetical protein